jgi:cation diffusion facilitator CzcD-associated flavoprotein CzcO
MAIKLLHQGDKDFLVMEKADEIGATWYANYPECL